MSQDYINNLPTEMFYQVFQYLNADERDRVADVCKRWSDIRSSERYLETLYLQPHHLTEDFDYVGRYKSIVISDFERESNELERFPHDEVVMSNLENLEIDLSAVRWNKLFGSLDELHFTKLRKIRLLNLQSDDQDMLVRSIFQNRINQRQQKWQLGDQIETLEIASASSLILPSVEMFPNLRSLTLDNIQHVTYADEDSFKMITRMLTFLSISEVPGLNLRSILDNARVLETLHISSKLPMSTDAYEAINNMKKLKVLILLVPIDEQARELSLPCLNELTISGEGLIPLKNVPSLRALTIEAASLDKRSVSSENMATYYQLFGHQLHRLTLVSLYLDKDHVSQICTLSNLHTLNLWVSEVEFADVEKICQSIDNLKLFRLDLCTVASEMILCKDDSWCECNMCNGTFNGYDEAMFETSEELITSFSNLRAQYEDCAIVTNGCKLHQRAEPRHILAVWEEFANLVNARRNR